MKKAPAKNKKSPKPRLQRYKPYDPAHPTFAHFFENGKEDTKAWATAAADFVSLLIAGEMVQFEVDGQVRTISRWPFEGLQAFLQQCWPGDQDIFFSPRATPAEEITWYDWCDTGRVHPSLFDPHPAAYWETSKGNYQAIWRWEKGIPIAASTARVEAMIHEYGGKLGSHRPDAFLRLPGCINRGKDCFPWPTVRMLYNEIEYEFIENQTENDEKRKGYSIFV
jgi:hypothetical protein